VSRARSGPLVALATGLLATLAIWRHPTQLAGGYDWRYFQSAMEAARRSLVWFQQAPLYNPWMCGGEPQLANPQSIAGSPAFLLVAAFGTAMGERLMMILFITLGLDGMRRLGRALGLSEPGAWAGALCFGLSGWVVLHFGIGHVSFFGATLIPHLIYFYLRARDDLRWSVAAGAVAAFIVAQGGTSTAAMAGLGLLVVAIGDAAVRRSARPFLIVSLAAAAALLLGAYRLLPALEFALDHPRRVTESDRQGLLDLVRTAFTLAGSGKLPGLRYAVHEYGWRLPFLAWPLALLGLVALLGRRLPTRGLGVAVFGLCLIGLGVAMGDAWPYGPWWLMRHLPVLRDLRVPSRYVLLAALGLSLLTGAGLDALRARLSGRVLAIATGVVTALLLIDGLVYANLQLAGVFDLPAPRIEQGAFQQEKGHWSRMLPMVYANRGVLGCDEEAPLTRALSLDEGAVPQARLDDPSAGTVGAIRWSPNRLEVEVALDRPASLLVNLNWNEHWKSEVGELARHGPKWPADKDGGRLSVRLPAHRGAVVLLYRPRSFVLGATLSLLSVLAIAIALWRHRARRA